MLPLKYFLSILFLLFIACRETTTPKTNNFSSDWSDKTIDRPWAGADYWPNPLQAWRQKDGQLRCEVSGGDRNVALLTREINDKKAAFEMSVDIEKITVEKENTALIQASNVPTDEIFPKGLSQIGWVGFQIGLQGQFKDYRDDVIKGRGLCAGITTEGKLFIGDYTKLEDTPKNQLSKGHLSLKAMPSRTADKYLISLSFVNEKGESQSKLSTEVHGSWLIGQMALTCSQSVPDTLNWQAKRPQYTDLKDLNKRVGGNTTFAFSNWEVSGEKITTHEERAYGPILWAQHTLSDDILKMSVQLIPVGNDNKTVELWIDGAKNKSAEIDVDGNNALFKVTNWDSRKAHPYKVIYKTNRGIAHTYEGTIRSNPKNGNLKLAAMSCVDDRGFPHQDLVDNVAAHQPDMLSFHGDQLYERVAGYGVERNSKLDYLRKWYIFGWSFRDLMRDIPTIIIPDDHDVFHGNLWGEGGKRADVGKGYGNYAQDSGGYKEPADFVNMVHRTQTGHLPDPYNRKPVLNDISVYYTNMNYGGVSFAILGDRQWKSAPKQFFPKAEIENGWPQNKQWNPKTEAFHPDAELLGARQEKFLEDWAMDWDKDIAFKTVISQSPFCNVATLPAHIWHDKYVPTLKRYKKGDYPKDDRPVADFDSNGWPQNKRDKAIKTIRKAFALHITGDQHLGSTGQYGVDEYGDGGYWISSPAVANLWPRRWFPAKAAEGGKEDGDARRYTGNYEDGFGNKITVKAIANPYDIDRYPSMVFDKAPGYSIIDFNQKERTMQLAVWHRWAAPNLAAPDNQPANGWPITIQQLDNYGRKVMGYLPEIGVSGYEIVQVVEEQSGDLLYSLRPEQGTFKAPVFDKSKRYTLRKLIVDKPSYEKKGLGIN